MDERMQRFVCFCRLYLGVPFPVGFYGLEFKYAFILDCRCVYLRNGSLVRIFITVL